MRRLHIQIQPRISAEMKELLDKQCQERNVTQGQVIDAALEAFFEPQNQEQSKYEVILLALQNIREMILATRLQVPLTAEKQSSLSVHEEEPVKIASSLEQYGPIEKQQESEEEKAPVAFQVSGNQGRLRRLFYKA